MNDYAINHRASRPLLDGAVLDTAIDEAIAVTGALLYWLPAGDAAWPEVALTLGRLSYDRYTDPWAGAAPPDPDDLDADTATHGPSPLTVKKPKWHRASNSVNAASFP